MRFMVSSPRKGQLGKHVVTCSGVPQPSIAKHDDHDAAQRLADALNAVYGEWTRTELSDVERALLMPARAAK